MRLSSPLRVERKLPEDPSVKRVANKMLSGGMKKSYYQTGIVGFRPGF